MQGLHKVGPDSIKLMDKEEAYGTQALYGVLTAADGVMFSFFLIWNLSLILSP